MYNSHVLYKRGTIFIDRNKWQKVTFRIFFHLFIRHGSLLSIVIPEGQLGANPIKNQQWENIRKNLTHLLNRTDVVTFRLTMIHNRYLTLMYLLIFHSHLQNTQNQRQHTSLFIYTSFFFSFFNNFCFLFMVPQTVAILTNDQLQFLRHSTMTKVINSLLHLINGNAILLTKASRLRVVLESTHECQLLKVQCHY